jgi:hypothetical protein
LLPHRLVFAFRGDALLAASDSLNVIDVSEAYRAVTGWIGPRRERPDARRLIRLVNGQLRPPGGRGDLVDRQPFGLT